MVSRRRVARRDCCSRSSRAISAKDDNRVLVVKAPSLTMNPTLPRAEIEEMIDTDPIMADCEYMAEFHDDIADFISPALIGSVVCGLQGGVQARQWSLLLSLNRHRSCFPLPLDVRSA